MHCSEIEAEQQKDNTVKIRSFKTKFKKSDQKIYKFTTEDDCLKLMIFFRDFQNLVFNHTNEKKIAGVTNIGLDPDESIFSENINYSQLVPLQDPIISNINLIIDSEINKFTGQIKDVMEIINELEIKTRNELIKIKTFPN